MKTNIFKLLTTLVIGAFLLSSCLKDDLQSPRIPQAGFSMVNIFSSSTFLINKADNNYIQTMNNPLRFKEINFIYLYPGNRNLETFDDKNNLILDSTFTIKDSLLYTSFIFNKTKDLAAQQLVEDKLLNTDESNAAFRFLNFSYDKLKIDLYSDDKKIIEDRNFDGNALNLENFQFTNIHSGEHTFVVKDKNNLPIIQKEVNLKSHIHYSLMLIKNSLNDQYELLITDQYRN